MKSNQRLPEDQVKIKISTCSKCNGIVKTAVEHMMSTKDKNDFGKEVLKYNLSVKTQSLIDFRNENADFCKCN